MSGDTGSWGRAATVTMTALLVTSAFVVFFSGASQAADITTSSSSSVTQGNNLDVTVKIDLDSDERIPIQEVALKLQRKDNAKLLKDIRWTPDCDGGSFSLIEAYDYTVASTSGCSVSKGGSSSQDSSDVHGYGYLRGDDLGYGYDANQGYGYFQSSLEETHTNGYGYGYGYDSGSSSLEWTVTIDTSNLPTTDIQTVGVIDTGTTALGDFQSDQSGNVVTVQSSDGGGGGGGGGGGDGAADEAKDLAEKAASGCRPSCDLGDLAQDATVDIDAGPDHPALVGLSFSLRGRVTNAKLQLGLHEPTSPPAGVEAPPRSLPATKLVTIEFLNGTEDASDQVQDLTFTWKLPDAWLSGADAGNRDFAIPQDLVTLGHFQDGEWVEEGATPAATPSDGDESTYDYFETQLDSLSTFATGASDTTGPTFSNARPTPATDDRQPEIGVDYSDDGVGIDASNVTISLDGTDVTADAAVTASGVTYNPISDLAYGDHTVTVHAEDELGNSATRTWTFEVVRPDDQAPTVLSVQPEEGATVQPDVDVTARYEDQGSPASGIHVDAVTLSVDGTDVTADATVNASALTYAPSEAFDEGDHSVTLELADRVGNEETKTWSFHVEVQEEEGFPWAILVGILVILGIAGLVGGYFYLNPEAADALRQRLAEVTGGDGGGSERM